MSKRESINEGCQLSSVKIARIEANNEIQQLPLEIIMKIISYLTDIKDIKNCLSLSKKFRYLMLSTRKIFEKFCIEIPSTVTEVDVADFLTNYGSNIMSLKLTGWKIEQQVLTFIMKQLPNLEELEYLLHFTDNKFKVKRSQRAFKLPMLKELIFNSENYHEILLDAKNIFNLESLSMFNHRNDHDELLTDFIVKLDNLKELTLIYYNYKKNPEEFPTRDISKDVKFKLTKLHFSLNYDYLFSVNEDFVKFFASQAEYLKDLSFNGDQVEDIYSIMFRYCKNLEKLSVRRSEYSDSSCFFCESDGYVLENVKHFESDNLEGQDLELIYGRLPNLETLVCKTLYKVEGTFNKLVTLKADRLSNPELKLPNLKVLTCEYAYDFNEIVKNAPNIEEIRIIKSCLDSDEMIFIICALKLLNNLKGLKIFEADFYDSYSRAEYKILINLNHKSINVSSDLIDKHEEISEILKNNFNEFSIKVL